MDRIVVKRLAARCVQDAEVGFGTNFDRWFIDRVATRAQDLRHDRYEAIFDDRLVS
jgi:hypothetical protein